MLNTARRRILPSTRPRFLWSPAPTSTISRYGVSHLQLAPAGVRTIVVDAPIPKKTKVWDSVDEAVADIKAGSVLLRQTCFQLDEHLI